MFNINSGSGSFYYYLYNNTLKSRDAWHASSECVLLETFSQRADEAAAAGSGQRGGGVLAQDDLRGFC